MSIPSLSLGGHDHYTPELRDRLLEKLRAAPFDQTAYHMLTPARLRALAEIEATDATVAQPLHAAGPRPKSWAVLGAHSFRVSATRP